MDRGEPAKAQQGPGLGRSETHSEARTGQRATFQRRRVPGSQSPRLKRQVLCGPGDGPGSPAPPRGPAWVSPRQHMGLGTLLGEEEDDNKLASRRIRTSTRRKNVPERFCPPPPPACPSETALAASLGPSGVRLRADERLQLDLFRPARPHSTAPPRTPRPTCPGTPESWSVGAPPQSLTGVNEDDPPRPGALGSGTFPCPPASPPPGSHSPPAAG